MRYIDSLPPTATRVELSTSPKSNEAIRERTDADVIRMDGATREELDFRIQALEREWDVERILQTNASTLVLAGLLLGAKANRRFLWLPVSVCAFLAQHALQGWCPPIPILRHLGVRTVKEIERERYALKALRGDFDSVPVQGNAPPPERVQAALSAVDA